MSLELTDVFRAATLIQWGLQPRVRPIQNAEYRELIREYLNRSEFRDVVSEMSDGLGLYVLNVSEHGIVLSPREESVFWMKSSEFRPSSSSSDTRLLDGLVEITIAATVFPRARDLEDDINRPRPPVTVDEIDETLRAICARFKEEFSDVDPNMDDVRTGLYDAWRVYDNTLATKVDQNGRESRGSTRRIINYNLERLKEFGCFTETRYGGKEAWQPTRRYNVLVQELAASRLYDEVMKILNGGVAQDGGEFEDEIQNPDVSLVEPEEDWGREFRDESVEIDELGDALPKDGGKKQDDDSDEDMGFDEDENRDEASENGEEEVDLWDEFDGSNERADDEDESEEDDSEDDEDFDDDEYDEDDEDDEEEFDDDETGYDEDDIDDAGTYEDEDEDDGME